MENNSEKKGAGRPVTWTEEKALELVNDLIQWLRSDDLEKVYIKRFLYERDGITPDLISYLTKRYKSFEEKLAVAKEIQEAKVATKALTSQYNPTMTVFFLKNKHNWKDKSDIELTGDLNTTFKVVFGSEDSSKNNDEESFNGESESEDN